MDIIYKQDNEYIIRHVSSLNIDDFIITCVKKWYITNGCYMFSVRCDKRNYIHFRIPGTAFEYLYQKGKKIKNKMRIVKGMAAKTMMMSKTDFEILMSLNLVNDFIDMTIVPKLPKHISDCYMFIIGVDK